MSSGLEKSGVTVKRYLFKEILSEEVRGKMCESWRAVLSDGQAFQQSAS